MSDTRQRTAAANGLRERSSSPATVMLLIADQMKKTAPTTANAVSPTIAHHGRSPCVAAARTRAGGIRTARMRAPKSRRRRPNTVGRSTRAPPGCVTLKFGASITADFRQRELDRPLRSAAGRSLYEGAEQVAWDLAVCEASRPLPE